jgi:hypothetical protein
MKQFMPFMKLIGLTEEEINEIKEKGGFDQ